MKTVVFLLGVYDKHTAKTGVEISQSDFDMIDQMAQDLGVKVQLMFAVPSMEWAGRAKDVTMAAIREHREQVFYHILANKPDVVVACGPVAFKCLMNKGNAVMTEHLREDIKVPELPDAVCVVTHSLESIWAKPGIEKHMMLDVYAALNGRTKTKWGKYTILQPGTPEWNQLPEQLVGVKEVGLDLETYPGLNPWHPKARIRMCVISDKVGRAWVVQARKCSSLPKWVADIAADKSIMCGGSNIKFDYRWLARFGYTLTNMFDTSTAEHVLDSTSSLTDLKSLTFLYCPKLGDYSRENRKLVAERGGWEHIEDHEQHKYCGGDGEASVAAMKAQKKSLKVTGLSRPFALSMGLYQVLADMETRGACISTAVHKELDESFVSALGQHATKLHDAFGPINLNSPEQLVPALRATVPGISLKPASLKRQLQGEYYKLHKGEDPDQYSTDKAVLEREAHKHPIIGDLLLYRRLTKLHGTYVVGLREKHLVMHPNGLEFIHASYRGDKVETYRLSCQGPNLQNIPRKPEPGDLHPIPPELNIKRMFVSRFPGGWITEGDASQAEIRVAAQISQDPALIAALSSGIDIHTAMCAQFHRKAPELVTKLERTQGKRQTFLILYGGGAKTLAFQLGIPFNDAKAILDRFFQTYPVLDQCIKQAKLDVKRDLYSESIFGYRRRFRKPARWDSMEGYDIERQAWNHKVQNPAACLTFIAMMDYEELLQKEHMESLLFMQVHDSMEVDTHPDEKKAVQEMLHHVLENPRLDRWGVEWNVPLIADVEAGPSWGEKVGV